MAMAMGKDETMAKEIVNITSENSAEVSNLTDEEREAAQLFLMMLQLGMLNPAAVKATYKGDEVLVIADVQDDVFGGVTVQPLAILVSDAMFDDLVPPAA
jgi:hypothetical protein